MNRAEVLQTLAILKAAYPHSFQVGGKPMPRRDAEAMVSLWERQFADEDPSAVMAAVDGMIATRTAGFSPTIGEIKDQMHRLRAAEGITEAKAWAMVQKACRRGLYNAREEFEKLPPDVQAAVGGPEQIRAWAVMDEETVSSVVASNFRRSFRTIKEREKEMALYPPTVKEYVLGMADKMKLGDGGADDGLNTFDSGAFAVLPEATIEQTGVECRPKD